MKKYIVIKAFSVQGKALLIPEDEVYAEEEEIANRHRIFNPKTRKPVGWVSTEKFKNSTVESSSFKIYDNSESKEKFNKFIDELINTTRVSKAKVAHQLTKDFVNEIF